MAAVVLAKFDYSYTHGGKTISFKIGDRFSLISKANNDWWHVKRSDVNGGFEEIYVPVLYVEEVAEPVTASVNNSKTKSLDRRMTTKSSLSKMELINMDANDSENIYQNAGQLRPILRPAPPPPQPKEERQKSPVEKSVTLPRGGSGSTFGMAISPNEFPDNPASPPVMSPLRNTPSPPFVPPKPVNRTVSADRFADKLLALNESAKPVQKRSVSVEERHEKSLQKRSSYISGLDEPETSSFNLSKSLPPSSGPPKPKPRSDRGSISEEPTPTNNTFSNGIGPRHNTVIANPISPQHQAPVARNKTGQPSSVSSNEEEELLPEGWKEYRTPDGTPYYYNEKTKDSSWKRPAAPKPQKTVIPPGWKKETTPFGLALYLNLKTNERWGFGQGDAGKTYYYNTSNPSQIAFALPEIPDYVEPATNGPVSDVVPSVLTPPDEVLAGRPRANSRSPPAAKKDSTPQPPPATVTTTTNPPSQPNTSYVSQLSSGIVNRHGYLYRKRIYDSAGKKVNRNWTYHYVILQDGMMSFYKDLKTARETPGAKSQSQFSLLYSSVSLPSTYVKRKNVFQVSASFGEQFYLQADTPQMMNDWYSSLQCSIKKIQDEKGSGPDVTDYSPSLHQRHNKGQSMVGGGSDSDDEIDTLDLIDTPGAEKEKSARIKTRLRKLIAKRPQAETLRNQGIILDNVFGCDLSKLVDTEGTNVPKFLVRCIEDIEKRGLEVVGIYRLSGNAAQVQKLRHRTDQDLPVNFSDEEWEDINIISGALKLFLRELPDPLIPYSLYKKFIDAGKQSPAQKIAMLKTCVKELPKANYATLKLLSNHLRKVMELSAVNKMQSTNLAIVFGPTIMRSDGDSLAIAALMPIQSRVMEAFLTDYDTIFS